MTLVRPASLLPANAFRRSTLLLCLAGLCALAPRASATPVHPPVHGAKNAGPIEAASVAEAATHIGQHVFFGTSAGTPLNLLAAVKAEALKRDGQTNGYFMATYAPDHTFARDDAPKFKTNLFFVSPTNRGAASGGWANFHGHDLFALAKALRAGEYGIDTVVVRVSRPNADGLVSLGETADLTLPAVRSVLERGGKIIAEVNDNVPFTHGDNNLRFEQLAVVVRNNQRLPDFPEEHPGLVARAIGRQVATLIPRRPVHTFQLGIGSGLTAVPEYLRDRHLVIFSEMGGDGMIPLLADENPAAISATFAFLKGGQLLREVVNQNPFIEMKSSEEVNDPEVIARKPRMIAVNTGLEVDLTGNVNAERIGDYVISAQGGQKNFMQGASQAPEGKAILALRSLNKMGQSTIVVGLHGPTTTPSEYVDNVVTEWGVTKRLRGLDAKKRTYQILRVAHPFHRPALAEDALLRGQITQEQYALILSSIYPSLLHAEPEMRARLAQSAASVGLISAEEAARIVASVPAGTMPDEAPVIPELAALGIH